MIILFCIASLPSRQIGVGYAAVTDSFQVPYLVKFALGSLAALGDAYPIIEREEAAIVSLTAGTTGDGSRILYAITLNSLFSVMDYPST